MARFTAAIRSRGALGAVTIVVLAALNACSTSPVGGVSTPNDSTGTTPTTLSAQDSEFIQPDSEEALLFMKKCVEEQGWIVEDISGGIHIKYRPEQQVEAAAAIRECSKQSLGLAPGETVPPPSDRQVRDYYQALVNARECLEARGFDLSDPPTLDSYLEKGIGSWDPYGEVLTSPGMGPSEFNTLTRKCPQPQLYR